MIDHNPVIECRTVPCVLCGSRDFSRVASGQDYEYKTSHQTFYFVSCLSCGHVYLNPRPTPASLPKAYPDHYYTLEGRHTVRHSMIIPRLKSLVIKHRLREFKNLFKTKAKILEVGCGDGSLLLDLKHRYPGLDLTGMDFSVSQDTDRLFHEAGIKLIRGRVEDTALEPESYDLIIMNQVIEHVPDPPSVLASLAKSLKPGGRISIETPNRVGYDRRFFKDSFWGGYYFPRHLHLFDKTGLTALLEKNGFVVEYHAYLLAPIIWAFSFHGLFSHAPWAGGCLKRLAGFFSDRNPLCLSIFTLVDILARLCGLATSNQKFIARKESLVD
ncbi:MAG: class I SAM-dependent methyltransferase [Proteobacteria bacterium]|nr:class I SAM-dependent methyltransferase [Pseudomonadota bacterium]